MLPASKEKQAGAETPEGYRMVESILVNNFRCFKHLPLHDLKRVNILVGDSGTGKTAIMEAIYLAASAIPQVALNFRRWRGLGSLTQVGTGRQQFESVWADLFNDLDPSHPIEISLLGSHDNTRSIRLFYKDLQVITLPLAEQSSQSAAAIRPLVFEWTDADAKTTTAEITIGPMGLAVAQTIQQPVLSAFFNTFSMFDNPMESAQMYSNLSQQRKERPVVEAVQAVFPRVNSLSVELLGGIPVLAVSTDGVRGKIPITLLSSGSTKLAHILLAIANLRGGVILIDEIENGFYFRSMPQIWPLLLEFARKFEAQIFASTHSQECLNAALPCIEANQADFTLLRCQKGGVVEQFEGRNFAAALEQGFEVR